MLKQSSPSVGKLKKRVHFILSCMIIPLHETQAFYHIPLSNSSYISGGDVRIEKDPDMTKLAQEARRLSMGQGQNSPDDRQQQGVGRRQSNTPPSTVRNGSGPRRPSEGYSGNRSPVGERRQSNGYSNPTHSSQMQSRDTNSIGKNLAHNFGLRYSTLKKIMKNISEVQTCLRVRI